jgi:hypothetical protein
MFKPMIAGAALALGISARQADVPTIPHQQLKEEAKFIELAAETGEATLVVKAESEEALGSLELKDPRGVSMFRMRATHGHTFSIQGFCFESKESSLDTLIANYSAGTYAMRAGATAGAAYFGNAVLSHEMPAAPVITYPQPDAQDVPSQGLIVTWVNDPDVVGYHVSLEQGESDTIIVDLPPGTDSFEVPVGILAPHTETKVEVGAIGANGNRTLMEFVFTTS